MQTIAVVIPAYQPGPALAGLVSALSALGVRRLVVVDDGSQPACVPIFERIAAAYPHVRVLTHVVNLGKGAALKTGINAALAAWPGAPGVVTADADGQHAAADILRVAAALAESPQTLVLGAREFRRDVPWRSRAGNRLTAFLMARLAGVKLADTQTGLRGIPAALARACLRLPTSGYEFELDMLLAARQHGVAIRELPIATIYLAGNASSHFNPLWDSMRISFLLARFTLASLATALADNLAFALAYGAGAGVLGAQVLGRCVAVALNYALVRGAVFRSRERHRAVFPKYLALVVANATVSYLLIRYLHGEFGAAVVPAKVAVETALFLASFAIQRDFVFRRRNGLETATDWSSYYRRVPPTARLTRRYSARALSRLLRRAGARSGAEWVELGGANSCFYDRFLAEFAPARYEVIDTNRDGLELLRQRPAPLELREQDVLTIEPRPAADIVFSAGLVEHFDPAGTRRAIAAHFLCCRPGGLVLITFPTPTWLYRAARALLEMAGLWRFPDERPLRREEVLAVVREHASIVGQQTLWPLVLTQHVVIACKA